MLKKFLVGLIILITFFQIFSPCALAIEMNSADIVFTGRTAPPDLVYRRSDGSLGTITCSIVGYYRGEGENRKFYPAYCLDGGKLGAETFPYTTTISQYIEDISNEELVKNSDKVWRIVTNAYPYNNMGLSDDDAYLVTKIAIYCVTGNADFGVYTYDPSRPVTIDTYNALKNLVEVVAEDTSISRQTGTITINKEGGLTESRRLLFSRIFS